jgi:patatin-like phospholipase/acyl hydrolase
MNGTASTHFRILALDSGGIKGAFTAAVLVAGKTTRLRGQDRFDMITGTSTGGILAIGLGWGCAGERFWISARTSASSRISSRRRPQ